METQTLSKPYQSILSRQKTELAIDFIKTFFPKQLGLNLDLEKVSAPMMVLSGTGINDDLNGIEKPVSFVIKDIPKQRAEIVHSLAKWKRMKIGTLKLDEGKGIYTNMLALRPDETLSEIHSIFVDQWDWEKRIKIEERNIAFLKTTVKQIYAALLATEKSIAETYPELPPILPQEIFFIHAEDLLAQYPQLTPKERENAITKQYGAVFIIGIGGKIADGEPHDGRAPDYDDWSSETEDGKKGLNGDILVWNPSLARAFELSSMGIRVDEAALTRQLIISGEEKRTAFEFHSLLLAGKLPQTIGGGIGQSRLCMFLLRKKHIGEVQASIWSEEVQKHCADLGIQLL